MAEMRIASLVAPVKSAPGLHYVNPRFPLNIRLPQKLECGATIYVHGVFKPDGVKFAINLRNAETDANNYFHFNPRLDEMCVVRNSRLDEAWGSEEREGDMPFAPSQPFLVAIHAMPDCFEVEVNGAPFITYNHREGMPVCDVSHISMWGDVTVYGVHIPRASMPTPLLLRVPKNTFIGDILTFKGKVPDGAARFHVNFQCGECDSADVMYHFNPRFDTNELVCNNRCADTWGEEDSLQGLPAAPGDPLLVSIVCSKDGFVPYVNGNPLPTFAHRLDVSTACTIAIDGDVVLEDVTVDCPPARLPPQVADIDIDSFEDKVVQALRASNPIVMKLPAGFGPGKAVYLSGRVDDAPERFELNLLSGDSGMEIAAHINPRWDDGPDVVMNSLEAEEWGEEVREPNPIAAGSYTELYLLCTPDGYDVMIDGDVVAQFPHRMDAGKVDHVSVNGNITVNRLMGV